MLNEIETAKKFFRLKFGSLDKTIPGVYSVPRNTAVSESFMRVVVSEDLSLSDFTLYMDEALTENWEETVRKYIPRKFD